MRELTITTRTAEFFLHSNYISLTFASARARAIPTDTDLEGPPSTSVGIGADKRSIPPFNKPRPSWGAFIKELPAISRRAWPDNEGGCTGAIYKTDENNMHIKNELVI